MTRRETGALVALAAVAAITVAWWSLAFWPASAGSAIARAREVCFGAAPDSGPDAAGWMALVLQPLIMTAIVGFHWGTALSSGLRALFGRTAVRALTVMVAATAVFAITTVAWKPNSAEPFPEAVPYYRVDRPTPPIQLVSQSGSEVSLEMFEGRPVLVTFAFGHCETVCPAVVEDVKRAMELLPEPGPVAMVVSLDPWRDTPRRLPHIADSFGLSADQYFLSGEVNLVEAVLDAWEIPRSRNQSTGDIIHPRIVYLVDAEGTLRYTISGGPEVIADRVRSLDAGSV